MLPKRGTSGLVSSKKWTAGSPANNFKNMLPFAELDVLEHCAFFWKWRRGAGNWPQVHLVDWWGWQGVCGGVYLLGGGGPTVVTIVDHESADQDHEAVEKVEAVLHSQSCLSWNYKHHFCHNSYFPLKLTWLAMHSIPGSAVWTPLAGQTWRPLLIGEKSGLLRRRGQVVGVVWGLRGWENGWWPRWSCHP